MAESYKVKDAQHMIKQGNKKLLNSLPLTRSESRITGTQARNLELLRNKELAFSKMLPNETKKVINYRNFYAFYLNSVIDEYIDRMRNRIISLCSSETIDARTLKFVQKPPEDLLSSHQVDVLQRVLSDARDLRIRSEAAIKYWFEIIDNSLKGSEDYKSDDELRIESYLCQRAEMRAFNNHQEDKKNE